MRDIFKAIQEHKERVLSHGYKEEQILGIFLYGSQNYGLATENSDVDTKAILVPNIENLAINPIRTKELHLENGEHCEVMDIGHFVSNLRKQNINFMEILFTLYKWVNPIYKDEWEYFFLENREEIARYDVNKCLKSICGQALHTIKQNPADRKKLRNGYRLHLFFKKYLKNEAYHDCIYQPDVVREWEREKLSDTFPQNHYCYEFLYNYFNSISSKEIPQIVDQEKVDEYLNKGILCLIQKAEYRRKM